MNVNNNVLKISLLLLRLSIFLVMFMWTLDKFINVTHAINVYDQFYFISGLSPLMMNLIGFVEIIIILAFVSGYMKNWSYLLVLILHAISTLSSFGAYLSPYTGVNLLLYAAWPMLAACIALYLLRSHDTLLSIDSWKLAEIEND